MRFANFRDKFLEELKSIFQFSLHEIQYYRLYVLPKLSFIFQFSLHEIQHQPLDVVLLRALAFNSLFMRFAIVVDGLDPVGGNLFQFSLHEIPMPLIKAMEQIIVTFNSPFMRFGR